MLTESIMWLFENSGFPDSMVFLPMGILVLSAMGALPFLGFTQRNNTIPKLAGNLVRVATPLFLLGIMFVIGNYFGGFVRFLNIQDNVPYAVYFFMNNEDRVLAAIPLLMALTLIWYISKTGKWDIFPMGRHFLWAFICALTTAGMIYFIQVSWDWAREIPMRSIYSATYTISVLTGGSLLLALTATPLITEWQRHS